MNVISPWTAAAGKLFTNNDLQPLCAKTYNNFSFKLYVKNDSCWLLTEWPSGGNAAFRMAYSPGCDLNIEKVKETRNEFNIILSSVIGIFNITVVFPSADLVIRFTTTLKPFTDLQLPYWPRDIIIPGDNGHPENTDGEIYVSQEGIRSGLMYFSMKRPYAGSVLYMQNLTALADYCQDTETSAGNTVGGEWPEMGFALPPAINKPLQANKELVISDALIAFEAEVPADEKAMVRQYLNMLAAVYPHLPKPQTVYHQWPDILKKGLKDLAYSPGCWSLVNGQAYLNAYVSDYATPPEIMVQLAVLLPLLDYVEWSGAELEIMGIIKQGLPDFYDEKLGTIMRWLPAAAHKLEGEEEQKKPLIMDSWYLHHPLLNLSRLALKGDDIARQLFVNSLDFAIKVAHHFNYEWPVFYKMDTLEVIKAETIPGKGGEKDVPGLYCHIMLQAYELTGKKKFLREAETAAKKLKGLGFDLFYQANNTAFSAGALLRLAKITKNELYKELSYLCIANLFRNVKLWDCNYGNGRHFPSYFAVFPLSNAPYTSVYEEQEVFCALHDYLKHAEGEEILPSVCLLIAEFIRFLVDRAIYYYPPMLHPDVLSDNVKIGELAPKLWIALEDMQDGWEKCGQVGQEVYGAGNAFGILPRHYLIVPGEDFMFFVDYPTSSFIAKKGKPVTFNILGNEQLTCRMMIVKKDKIELPSFTVILNDMEKVKGVITKEGHIEYALKGKQKVKISWK